MKTKLKIFYKNRQGKKKPYGDVNMYRWSWKFLAVRFSGYKQRLEHDERQEEINAFVTTKLLTPEAAKHSDYNYNHKVKH